MHESRRLLGANELTERMHRAKRGLCVDKLSRACVVLHQQERSSASAEALAARLWLPDCLIATCVRALIVFEPALFCGQQWRSAGW